MQHRRPEQGMEIDDVLANEMDHLSAAAGPHYRIEVEAFALAIVLEAGEVADWRVQPDVQVFFFLDIRDPYPEVGRVTRYVPVGKRLVVLAFQPFLRLVGDLRLQPAGVIDPS